MARLGRPPDPESFRGFCKRIALDPTCIKAAQAKARKDPDFWLKLAEHGYGRPPAPLGGGSDAASLAEMFSGMNVQVIVALPAAQLIEYAETGNMAALTAGPGRLVGSGTTNGNRKNGKSGKA